MPTNLGAELSPAQKSANHDSLSHTPYITSIPGPLATHRADVPPIIMLPPVLTRSTCAARPLAHHPSDGSTVKKQVVPPFAERN